MPHPPPPLIGAENTADSKLKKKNKLWRLPKVTAFYHFIVSRRKTVELMKLVRSSGLYLTMFCLENSCLKLSPRPR